MLQNDERTVAIEIKDETGIWVEKYKTFYDPNVIRAVCETIKYEFNTNDVRAVELGGQEFTMILPSKRRYKLLHSFKSK